MVKYWLKTTILLYILWILLSGRIEARFLIEGFATAAVAATISLNAMWIPSKDGSKRFFLLDVRPVKFICYWLWLLKEIAKSSWGVSVAVLSPKMKINPQIVEFDYDYENPIAVSLLINSIILTPGTVTIDVADERHFTVHALTDDAAEGLLEGTMQRKIASLFNE